MRAGDDATSAYLNGARVTINQLATKMKRTKRFYLAMKTMVEFDNNNLATFLGVCTQPTRLHIVWEHCEKGSIYGLEYIHHSPMKYHGNLTSKCCVIDHEWRGKITDFGMRYFTDGDWKVESVEDDHTLCHNLLWTSPEVVRKVVYKKKSKGNPSADVYSFGIVVKELICWESPYCVQGEGVSPKGQYEKKIHYKIRNYMLTRKSDVLNYYLTRASDYYGEISSLVTTSITDRERERRVADTTKRIDSMDSEIVNDVIVGVFDIMNFGAVARSQHPKEVIRMLQDIQLLFDTMQTTHNLFEVNTVTDARLVCSSYKSPYRQSALQMYYFATRIKDELKHIESCNEILLVRIGLNCGHLVASRVGEAVRKYCLFGTTISLAYKLMAQCKQATIHISDTYKEALSTFDGFKIEPRIDLSVQNTSVHETYWLLGREYDTSSEQLHPPTTITTL
ncbi:hypothetical protein ScPMuIL_015729 [Solemya velum]